MSIVKSIIREIKKHRRFKKIKQDFDCVMKKAEEHIHDEDPEEFRKYALQGLDYLRAMTAVGQEE